MKSDDLSVEHVQVLVEQAERLRMQSAAVPVKELKALLRICETANDQRNVSDDQSTIAGSVCDANINRLKYQSALRPETS